MQDQDAVSGSWLWTGPDLAIAIIESGDLRSADERAQSFNINISLFAFQITQFWFKKNGTKNSEINE